MTMIVNQDLCRGCGICMEACPNNAIFLKDCKASITQTKCTSCQICAEVCPTGALQLERIVTPAIGDKLGAIEVIHPQTANVSLPDQSGWGQTALALAGQYVLPRLMDILETFFDRRLSQSVPKQISSTQYPIGSRPFRQSKHRHGRFSKSIIGRR